jgi:hypothetical protein
MVCYDRILTQLFTSSILFGYKDCSVDWAQLNRLLPEDGDESPVSETLLKKKGMLDNVPKVYNCMREEC